MMDKKLRAVALCRCSTEEESQRDVLVQQSKEARECIEANGWQLVDMYVEAKSGTTTKGRKEFNRLLQDIDSDKFDIIVIKSIDRLVRNVKDWYIFLDKMLKAQKKLYIYIERKFYQSDDTLISGIRAILAEDYSRELSKKINNAHRGRQKEGKVLNITNATYGYKKLKDKSVCIDEDEAVMIRRIFELSIQGYGRTASAKILYDEGYRNRKGGAITAGVIGNIVRNPLYMGEAVQNKEHFDFDSKILRKNPKEEWIHHKGAVPAIIDELTFRQANEATSERVHLSGEPKSSGKSKGEHDFSGKIKCGLCGNKYYRTTRKCKNSQCVEWKCATYVTVGRQSKELKKIKNLKYHYSDRGCDNIHLNEENLYKQLEEFAEIKYADISKKEISDFIISALSQILSEKDNMQQIKILQENIRKWEKQKSLLMDKYLEGLFTEDEVTGKLDDLRNKIEKASSELSKAENFENRNMEIQNRVAMLEEKMNSIVIDKAKAATIIHDIDEIVVYPDRLELQIDTMKALNLDGLNVAKEGSIITLPVKCGTNSKMSISTEKEIVMQMMRENPHIKAKGIADANGWCISRVNRRITELKKEGKIECTSPNGRGVWKVSE